MLDNRQVVSSDENAVKPVQSDHRLVQIKAVFCRQMVSISYIDANYGGIHSRGDPGAKTRNDRKQRT